MFSTTPRIGVFSFLNIAIALDRKVTYDVKKHEFIGDEQANRLRSEALREPWRL
jgi:hypothetical protein